MIRFTCMLALICFLTIPVKSNATSLVLGGISRHTSSGYWVEGELVKWNETNKLLAIEHKNLFVGKMENSYNENTTFAGYIYDIDKTFGVMGLLTNKYGKSELPKIGSLRLGGFFTVKLGPLLFLTVPSSVYVMAFQLKL